MDALSLVNLSSLMKLTSGKPEIVVGLVDGPVLLQHPDLSTQNIRQMRAGTEDHCGRKGSLAWLHGTYVAGILSAKRGSVAPAICPGCTLLSRPIFTETTSGSDKMPSATPKELATAIIDCVKNGAFVINMSLGLTSLSLSGERELEAALDHAAKRGVLAVAAAGNQATLGSSALTRHPWVIPVVACDLAGKPIRESNLGSSIGRRGLRAPGHAITSLGSEDQSLTLGGTSVAAPFVTATIALLFSLFPNLIGSQMRLAIAQAHANRRSIAPPLLNASAAYDFIQSSSSRN
jgi:subtilisin family serine protease